jgi:hypothetical protein
LVVVSTSNCLFFNQILLEAAETGTFVLQPLLLLRPSPGPPSQPPAAPLLLGGNDRDYANPHITKQ